MIKILPFLAMLASMSFARGVEIQGVKVPPSVEINGQTLPLNGAGLRTFSFLMVPIKIYVAAFYAPGPLRTEQAVLGSQGPMEFTFTFLRAVDASDVAKAWSSQFAASNTHSYAGFEKDLAAFVGMFGALQTGGVQTVRFIGTDTRILDQGVPKGSIAGRDFQLAFLSLWFGSDPVSPDLKSSLLGN